MRLSVRQVHYLLMLFLIVFFSFFQAYVLGRASWSVFHIDFLTIFVVYMAVEHQLFDALVRTVVAALVLSTISAAPSSFFVMYYIQVLVIATLVSKRVALWGKFSQLALFVLLLSLKYFLFVLMVVAHGGQFHFWSFVVAETPGVFSTTLLALPCFRLFSFLDMFFEVQRGRDESDLSLS
jgi:hypothetical protein